MSDNDSRYGHIPVMLDRCYELLAPALTAGSADGSGAVLIDATLGRRGIRTLSSPCCPV
ncbi:ribosomal RNA small subunit methyltransferase H domain protein [Mycobacteroides abscessus MAB_091912_2446]|uniref:Ribosomal RNA small subunit methyltransferase H domain protein n=1 Tax=Mycobacteroides abscessus MAB_091912_2446 TaxID=1335414 RepID=A0A829M8Z9_9MYCO|nr:ribosomal RNA small subunit methyltransferase H domain protein [Mycobacteroides abscessus MAB_091912_2446]